MWNIKRKICLYLYYSIAINLPESNKAHQIGGHFRRFLCKRIFLKCGKNVNIEKGANFGNGRLIEIDDYSGIGINARVPNNIKIGKYVMMGPNCFILDSNHAFHDLHTPMMFQGYTEKKQTVIEDDVWIGCNVTMTAGRFIKKGSIVAAGTVLTKDFPEYTIIGGNPGKIIRSRNE